MNQFVFANVFYPLFVILFTALLSIVAIVCLTSKIKRLWVKLIYRCVLISILVFLVSSTIVLLFIRS